ncbi:MAG TPA: methyl-accepting chemotaxis protein, partial [Anaeromyxobacteraceae bacterium]|nr:methyl-accepting chemotaxis protein [Anaeromyxobacteraceae bacterium]
MRNLSVGSRLGVAFGVVCTFLAVAGWIGLAGMASMDEAIDRIVRTDLVKVQSAADLADAAMEISRNVDGMFLARDAAELRRLSGVVEGHFRELAEIEGRLVALGLDDADRRSLDEGKRIAAEASARLQSVDRLLAEGAREAAQEQMERDLDPLLVKLEAVAEALAEDTRRDVAAAVERHDAAYATRRQGTLVAIAAALALAIGFAVYATRSITTPVATVVAVAQRIAAGDLRDRLAVTSRDELGTLQAAMATMTERLSGVIAEVRAGSEALTAASQQVSATSQALSQGTGEQAASVEETTSSLEEMSASIGQNAENSRLTEQMASQGARSAEESGVAVTQTVGAMRGIADKIGIV